MVGDGKRRLTWLVLAAALGACLLSIALRVGGPSDGARIGFYAGAWSAAGVRIDPIDAPSGGLYAGDLVTSVGGRSLEAWVRLGFLLLGVGGLGAAWQAGVLLAPWAIASYVVLALVIGVMYGVATTYYIGVRELVSSDGAEAPGPEALRRALDTRRPEVLTGVGSVGMLVLLWLMVVRPA